MLLKDSRTLPKLDFFSVVSATDKDIIKITFWAVLFDYCEHCYAVGRFFGFRLNVQIYSGHLLDDLCPSFN